MSRRRRWSRVSGRSLVARVIDAVQGVDVHVIAGAADEAEEHADGHGPRRRQFPLRRRVAGWSTLVMAGPILAGVMVDRREHVSLTTVTEVFLAFVVVIATIGGLVPGV